MPAGLENLGQELIVMNVADNVATALRDLSTGDTVHYSIDGKIHSLISCSDIPFGHKIAILHIESESHIIKYGEVIGRATQSIDIGVHVHVHNVEGIRGRGDLTRSRR